MIISYQNLSDEVLQGIIEAYILQEGTDYGQREVSITQKIDTVLKQLKSGKAVITFDEDTETCAIQVS